jgi:CHASE1-domain containing sensor protein
MNPVPEPSVGRRLGEILGLAAAYVGTGKLALLLAIPPGNATAIWPPAGIALAALLLFGARAWPGVLLGSFLVNLSTPLDRAALAVISAGASAQALLGAALVRRFVGSPLELLRGRDILKFLVLGGPVSCVVNATVAVAALHARDVIQVREIPFNAWTWWVGDVIGVVVVAPLVLIALGSPREVWRRRAVPVAVPLGVLLVVTGVLFGFVRRWERSGMAVQFKLGADATEAAIGRKVRDSVEMLHSLESFRSSSPAFDRKAFGAFATRALQRCPSVRAVSWNPVVSDAERDAFESDGACRITERDAKNRLVPAPRRSEYVPVRYIEPFQENAAVVGFDVSSSIVRFEAMKRAGESGKATATRRFRLMQDADASFSVLVFLPTYASEERRRTPSGYFVGVVRLDDFFAFLEENRKTLGIDVSIRAGDELLWQTSRSGESPPEIRQSSVANHWGGPWTIDCAATPEYLAASQSWTPWGVLAAGMGAAGLLGAFLLATTGRALLQAR